MNKKEKKSLRDINKSCIRMTSIYIKVNSNSNKKNIN